VSTFAASTWLGYPFRHTGGPGQGLLVVGEYVRRILSLGSCGYTA
jgi:hypothetical protein